MLYFMQQPSHRCCIVKAQAGLQPGFLSVALLRHTIPAGLVPPLRNLNTAPVQLVRVPFRLTSPAPSSRFCCARANLLKSRASRFNREGFAAPRPVYRPPSASFLRPCSVPAAPYNRTVRRPSASRFRPHNVRPPRDCTARLPVRPGRFLLIAAPGCSVRCALWYDSIFSYNKKLVKHEMAKKSKKARAAPVKMAKIPRAAPVPSLFLLLYNRIPAAPPPNPCRSSCTIYRHNNGVMISPPRPVIAPPITSPPIRCIITAPPSSQLITATTESPHPC